MSSTRSREQAGLPTVAVLGLGEAGSRFARDLLGTGADVVGWDPAPRDLPEGLRLAESNVHAARQARLVLSVNLATAAREVAREVAPVLGEGQVFAEMNTGSPQLKRDVAAIVRESGALFADVAIMAPVPPQGLWTPFLVSGSGADAFRELLAPLDLPITVVGDEPGTAATRKLLRSIAYKGFAAVVMECLEAARRLDLEDYAREQIATLVDEDLIDRFESGTVKHARRRTHEMEAVEELLSSIGVQPHMSGGALRRLRELGKEGG